MASQEQARAAGAMTVPATQPGPGRAPAVRGWGELHSGARAGI